MNYNGNYYVGGISLLLKIDEFGCSVVLNT